MSLEYIPSAALRLMRAYRPGHLIGIDEAGRGPLAGPVVVAGVRCRAGDMRSFFSGIRDSKQLSARQREDWYQRITAHPEVRWAVTSVSPAVIDRINISAAANLGATRVARTLFRADARHGPLSLRQFALLDGGLRLTKNFPYESLIKGDERIPVIAAASIIAKVTRDRIMLRLCRRFPQYRFELHKGYGTLLHRKLINEFGRSPVHRATFRVSDPAAASSRKVFQKTASLTRVYTRAIQQGRG